MRGGEDDVSYARGPTVHRMMLGRLLQRLRVEADISSDDAAQVIRASRSKISRMENGRVSFKDRDVTDLLSTYGATDPAMIAKVRTLARRANAPGWWTRYADVTADWFEEYLGLETAASMIRTFEVQFVPGLFQTPEYARAVIHLGHSSASPFEIDRRVDLRMSRQDVLSGQDPPVVWSILDEGAIRRPVGGRAVMRRQLSRLVEAASDRGNVVVQVVPVTFGGYADAGGSFSMLRFPGAQVPDIVYVEQLTSALYLDKREDVDHYLEVIDCLCTEALSPVDSLAFIMKAARELLPGRGPGPGRSR